MLKTCNTCLQQKDKTLFYKRGAACKKCFLKDCAKRYRANPEAMKLRVKLWKDNNKERDAINEARYRERNRENINKRAMQRYHLNKERQQASSAKWRAANKARIKEVNAVWDQNNKDKLAVKRATRRFAKQRAVPAWANHDDIR